jgi:malate dehydrogenase (oxaloacetate-decarboxylating)(NADP+)
VPDTSYPIEVRKKLGIYGLTPPNVESHALQSQRCMKQLASKTTPIEKYIYLSNLRNTNTHLFYRLVLENFTVWFLFFAGHVTKTNSFLQTIAPLIYTPVVGEACLKWSEIYQRPEGMFIDPQIEEGISPTRGPPPLLELSIMKAGS